MPWRRRGGCSPAAAPPLFRLLFRHPVGSSPIGQFKPPPEPLGFRHLGPAPSVTEMPRPTGTLRPLPGHAAGPPPRRQGDGRRLPRKLACLVPPPFRVPRPLRHFCPGPPDSRAPSRSPRNTVGSRAQRGTAEQATGRGFWKATLGPSPLSADSLCTLPRLCPSPTPPKRKKEAPLPTALAALRHAVRRFCTDLLC